ncbi:retrotransposon protein, putative, ty1-copia subclass [Tanacetum coccineum]
MIKAYTVLTSMDLLELTLATFLRSVGISGMSVNDLCGNFFIISFVCPVVRHTSIRVILALTACKDYELEQLDVKTAFLHGNLEEVIYMKQPPGYEQGNKVCLLKKSLYGLKQSPRQWYRRFDEYMLSNGFKRSSYDSCVYYRSYAPGEYIYLLLYVDDMLIACKSKAEIGSTKSLLKKEFDMKELGEAKKILGMEIVRDRSRKILRVSQSGYVSKILNNFRIDNGKSVKMPLGGHFKLSLKDCPVRDCDVERMSKVSYANAVGSLMYLMVCTRPDIAYAVSVVSRYLANPGKNHWEAVKWILKYLWGTANVGLVYGTDRGNHVDVTGFVDSDYAKDPDKGRSITGYAFLVQGCVVSWKATLQHVVALSTTEAEYMALTEAVKEAIWLKGLLEELGVELNTVAVNCDNQGAIHLSRNHVFHERTKHINVRYHFIREVLEAKTVKVLKVGTEHNAADALTKVVPGRKLQHCLELLKISCSDSSLAVPMFQQGEDPIECINKAMTFLSAVASRFPPSNNQIRTSSNPRNQATIQDGRVIVQQCTQPKRPRNAARFKEKLMLAEAQEAGQILDEEQLAFLAIPGLSEALVAQQTIPQNSAFQTKDLDAYDLDCDDLSSAKAVLMTNLSSCDPEVLSELNKIKEDFGKSFVTQKELSAEQAFWLKHSSFSETPVTSHTPVRIEAPSELPKISLVNESLKKLKYQLANFNNVVKKKITSDAITADEITEVQTVFNQMEAVVDQCSIDKNAFEIQIKQLSIDNDQLLKQIMSQEIMHITVNSVDSLDVKKSCVNECNKCLELETELLKKKDLSEKDVYDKLLKSQSQEKDTVIIKLKDRIKYLSGKDSMENIKKDMDGIETINIELEHRMFKLDIQPISHRLKNNRDAHEVYIENTIENTDTLRGFVERARTHNPSEPLLEFACMFTKHVQELLVYVSQTCPNSPKPSEKLVVITPMNKDTRVRFVESVISSSNIPKQTDSLKTKDSNKPLLISTGVKPTTSASRSKRSSNTRNNRITQPPSRNQKNKIEDHSRKVKSSLNKMNSISEPVNNALVKYSMRNAKFESMCTICNKCLFDANHDMRIIDYINDVNVVQIILWYFGLWLLKAYDGKLLLTHQLHQ